jgi:Raf kinase inhibitor-like YbhB/YbcL family protein
MRGWPTVLAALLLAGCGSTSSTSSSRTSTSTTKEPTLAKGFVLTSPAFENNGRIPRRYTCDGAGTPIPLHWSGVPRRAKELVVVMRDPDASGAPFVHWAISGISPDAHTLAANARQGRNSAGSNGYAPPCPPHADKAHHYVITITALSGPSNLKNGFSPDQLRTSAVAIATLIGLYSRA